MHGGLPAARPSHVYLDMGNEDQLVCPYCSTLYSYDARLAATDSDPPSCVFVATAPPGAPEA